MDNNNVFPVILGAGIVQPSSQLWDYADRQHALMQEVKELSKYFPSSSLRRIPLYARIGLLAAVRALISSHSFPCPPDMPLLIGTAYSCQKTSLDFMDSILDDGPRLASPLAFSHAVNNMAAGLISLMLGCTGSCCTVNTCSLSFAGAIQLALTHLLAQRSERILVGILDEADPRFEHIFPEKQDIPSAVFFSLGLGTEGRKFTVSWNNQSANDSCSSIQAAVRCYDAWKNQQDFLCTCHESWSHSTATVCLA